MLPTTEGSKKFVEKKEQKASYFCNPFHKHS